MSRIDKLFNKNKNRSGGESFSSDIKERYIQTLLTNTMTNTFYLGSGELLDQSKELHARMVYKDPSFVKKALVYARNKGSMRSNPYWV
jgi:60 kDa SS-A/Ro ribonucleoprotein